MIHRLLVLLSLLVFTGSAWAEHGPRIPPCEGCPQSPTEFPYPRVGMWWDPARSGTGMNLEVQNGVAYGLWYGFDEDGRPVWYEFSGSLQPMPEGEDGYWQLQAPLAQFSGGSCIGCPYEPPEVAGVRGTLHLKVIQRNLISYRLDDGEEYRLQPLVWGTPMPEVFPEVSDHGQPMVAESEWASPWAPQSGQTPWVVIARTPVRSVSVQFIDMVGTFWVSTDANPPAASYQMSFFSRFPDTPEVAQNVTVRCGRLAVDSLWQDLIPTDLLDALGSEPLCIMQHVVGAEIFRFYVAPLADIGDDYVRFTATDGSVIEGFRLLYR